MSKSFVKFKVLGKSFLKRSSEGVRWGAARLAVDVAILAWLHLLIFSRHHLHEYRATLNGGLKFRRLAKPARFNPYFVRRGTHRLEKGLIMRPRRAVFAEDYIEELVDSFLAGCEGGEISAEDKAWAESVLNTYFLMVEDTPVTVGARKKFDAATRNLSSSSLDRSPTPVRKFEKDDDSLSALEKLVVRRRSIRWFKDAAVSDDIIEKAVEIAGTAPSACNRQPYTYVVSHGRAAQKIGGYALGATALAHQFPCVIAVVGDLSAYSHERDRHAIYVDGSLSAMQLLLALEASGLGSCVINWPDIPHKDKAIAKELGLRPYQRTIMLIAVGYPEEDQLVPYSAKRSVSSVIVTRGKSL